MHGAATTAVAASAYIPPTPTVLFVKCGASLRLTMHTMVWAT